MTSPTIIRDASGQPVAVVLDWPSFARVATPDQLAGLSDEDLAALGAARAGGETVPGHVVSRLLAGDAPLKVWREHRGMTQEELARRVGITATYVSQIERGTRHASAKLQARLAELLGVDLDDLDPVEAPADAEDEAA